MMLYTMFVFFVNYLFVRNHIFFFFNDTATTEIYTLSLHDALPICECSKQGVLHARRICQRDQFVALQRFRSEEHTSELQSQSNLVCRLLLEKKKIIDNQVSYFVIQQHFFTFLSINSDA